MTVNLVKLCVGVTSIDDLARWQAMSRNQKTFEGRRVAYHTTFQTPTRQADLLAGGSLYWVIKGTILVRQPIVGFGQGKKADGSPCCLILLSTDLIPVRAVPRRAFQGWRYLSTDDAPPDVKAGASDDVAAMPPKMCKTLADLGLI
ncbi:MAG: DUF1489 domain-containing protein [Hyphomicrobium sp.]